MENMSVFRPFFADTLADMPALTLSNEELEQLQFGFKQPSFGIGGESMPFVINDDAPVSANMPMADFDEDFTRMSVQALQEKLREKEGLADKLNATMAALPVAVLLVDGFGVISDANPQAEKLLDESQCHPLIGSRWSAVIKRCFSPRPDDGHDISLVNGRIVSVATSALKSEGQILVITDQTDTRKLQQQVSQNQRLTDLGRMTASLAHQIRTPLSAAMLYGQNMLHPKVSEPKKEQFNHKLMSQLQQLEQQLQQMLLFARGDIECSDQLLSQQILAQLKDTSEAVLDKTGSSLIIHNQAYDQKIKCNAQLLYSVLMNLVNNACEAVGNNAQIEVVIRHTESNLLIEVSDHGPGIRAAQIDQVCEPFFSTKSHGTGLGLAVAKSIIEAHQGQLNIESELNEGCCITLQLPLLGARV
jgi:two-component system, sensor histidine kinase FlrB